METEGSLPYSQEPVDEFRPLKGLKKRFVNVCLRIVSVHLMLLNVIAIVTFGEEYKLL
jgi:hypothetical protein